eukprot:6223211-Lingulodinium_polyedra.AAC.1
MQSVGVEVLHLDCFCARELCKRTLLFPIWAPAGGGGGVAQLLAGRSFGVGGRCAGVGGALPQFKLASAR